MRLGDGHHCTECGTIFENIWLEPDHIDENGYVIKRTPVGHRQYWYCPDITCRLFERLCPPD